MIFQKMKRIACLFSVLIFCSGLAACGRNGVGKLNPLVTGQQLAEQLSGTMNPNPQVDGYLLQQNSAGGVSGVADRINPCVVGLTVQKVQTGQNNQSQLVEGLGSGVIVDGRGYILTNSHVAGNATSIVVVFQDGSKQQGTTLWSDDALDLAVVKCEGGPYQAASLGSVNDLKVGETVLAVGTPLDLAFQHTVTAGIVSAKNRTLELPTEQGVSFMEQLIQTDASINPGNSGGPLVNMQCQVVGINTVKLVEAEGIGFAIPIDVSKPIIDRILKDGTYQTPYIGMYAIDKDIARYYDQDVTQGIAILNVDPAGPAYASGIRKGDVLLSINGTPVSNMLDLRCRMNEAGVGGTMVLEWSSNGANKKANCVLTAKPK